MINRINRVVDSLIDFGERKLGVSFPDAIPSQDEGSVAPYDVDRRNQLQWGVGVIKVTVTDFVGSAVQMIRRGK